MKLFDGVHFGTATKTFNALVIAGLGGAFFDLLGLPAPYLSGGMIAVAAAAFLSVPLEFPELLKKVAMVVLGISMGAGVTPEAFERVGSWPITILLIGPTMGLMVFAAYQFLSKLCHWRKDAAYFSSIPGTLGLVAVLAEERNSDLPRIMTVQVFRLFVLLAFLPSLLVSTSEPVTGAVVASVPYSTPFQMLILVAACVPMALIADRIGIPAGLLTGAFIVSSALNVTATVPVHLPSWVEVPVFMFFGAMIGARFGSTSPAQVMSWLRVSIGSFMIVFAVCVAVSAVASYFLDLSFGQLVLAYSPGGLEVMTLLAFVLNLDPAFVATHQILRYIGMLFVLPFATRLVLGPKTKV
ncbi:AbrB family transcriptional regulator [Pseudovibrio exalbescens]|uniref:AbrB family transcriptional regulator n=1 Tax=Pseudovibrio exalbescens TaxID=197461 RepID=UPI002365EC80|nr:AbrB family transcriptional regulator [Pseudovibrio exalbescens]MDD7911102.1 AbrB family transcriptional regulator [Pseudovibrio exalbescens]